MKNLWSSIVDIEPKRTVDNRVWYLLKKDVTNEYTYLIG